MKEKEDLVLGLIRRSKSDGMTITEVVKQSKFPRSVVRIVLARLEGAGKIGFRKVGMAKIYSMR